MSTYNVEKSSEKAGIGQISVKNVSTCLLLPGPRLAVGGNSASLEPWRHEDTESKIEEGRTRAGILTSP